MLTMEEAAARLKVITDWLEAVDLVLLRPPVLSLAGEPLPAALGTLDAIHLATARIWRDRVGPLPVVATHDAALAVAARAFGFDVLGV
jgi:predicted nucleic acid-binding protein